MLFPSYAIAAIENASLHYVIAIVTHICAYVHTTHDNILEYNSDQYPWHSNIIVNVCQCEEERGDIIKMLLLNVEFRL